MICPNCIEPLIKNKKKLGDVTNWLVCPLCGYRTRQTAEENAQQEEQCNFIKRIRYNNQTGGKHDEQL